MRELHDGMELLEEELDGGAFVWRNWDKWVERCELVITWIDHEVQEGKQGNSKEEWRKRGFVCGVEWKVFRKTVENYRDWLYRQLGGVPGVRERLVFSHNDVSRGHMSVLQRYTANLYRPNMGIFYV